MSSNHINELTEVSSKIDFIIKELDDISNGVRSNLDGIGNDICASSLEAMADNYRDIKRKVDNVSNEELEQCRKNEEG